MCKLKVLAVLLLLLASQTVNASKSARSQRNERNKKLTSALELVRDIILAAKNCNIEDKIPSRIDGKCGCEKAAEDYFNVAIDFIQLVIRKYDEGSVPADQDFIRARKRVRDLSVPRPHTPPPMDCLDVLQGGRKESGVYSIRLKYTNKLLDVYCDMTTDGGGWTLIQRRDNYTLQENFNRNWTDYKEGFGNVTKDFWLGNENLHHLSNQGEYSIRFDLEDVERAKRYALYEHFRIEGEEAAYRLFIRGYIGDAGDAMTMHRGMKFSTPDRKNDVKKNGLNCASLSKSGWWFGGCSNTNPNGLYRPGYSDDQFKYMYWYNWKTQESLKAVQMKLKRLS